MTLSLRRHSHFQRDRLKKFAAQTEKVMAHERALARRFLSEGQQSRARLLLRKRQFQEKSLATCESQMINLEQMVRTAFAASISPINYTPLSYRAARLHSDVAGAIPRVCQRAGQGV